MSPPTGTGRHRVQRVAASMARGEADRRLAGDALPADARRRRAARVASPVATGIGRPSSPARAYTPALRRRATIGEAPGDDAVTATGEGGAARRHRVHVAGGKVDVGPASQIELVHCCSEGLRWARSICSRRVARWRRLLTVPGRVSSAAAVSCFGHAEVEAADDDGAVADVEVVQCGATRGFGHRPHVGRVAVDRRVGLAAAAVEHRRRPVEADAVHPAAGVVVGADLRPTGIGPGHRLVDCFGRQLRVTEGQGQRPPDLSRLIAVEVGERRMPAPRAVDPSTRLGQPAGTASRPSTSRTPGGRVRFHRACENLFGPLLTGFAGERPLTRRPGPRPAARRGRRPWPGRRTPPRYGAPVVQR